MIVDNIHIRKIDLLCKLVLFEFVTQFLSVEIAMFFYYFLYIITILISSFRVFDFRLIDLNYIRSMLSIITNAYYVLYLFSLFESNERIRYVAI